MSDGLLPNRVNIRKAVTRSARYSGVIGPKEMGVGEVQLASVGDNPEEQGVVAVTVEFGEDEEHRQYADVALQATAVLECQRCLQPVALELKSRSRLGLVRTDEEARQLPADYEPWLAIDEVDLWRMAGEEFALAMPVVAYHDNIDCASELYHGSDLETEQVEAVGERADSPFSVLSALLADGDDCKEEE